MKRGKKLLILFAVLALAAGGYLLAVKLDEKESAKQTTEEVKLVEGEVTGLKWTHAGEELDLVLNDGLWALNGKAGCPVDQETARAMVETVAGYTAQASVSGNVNAADYGLDEAAFEVAVTTANGEAIFKQGDENPLTGQTYVSKSTDAAIYAADASLEDMFAISSLDLAANEEIPTIGDATELSIDGKVAQRKDADGAWRSLTGEKSDEIKIEALFDAIREIKWSKLVDWTGETKLEDPISVRCAWPDGEFEVIVGQKTDDGYLAQLPGSNMVYAIEAANAEVILASGDEELRSTKLFDADWDGDNELSASIGGVEYALSDEAVNLIREIETAELAAPSGSEMITVTVNGSDCVIRDYDTNNCTATINGTTRLIPAESADKLIRLVKYA